MLETLRIPLLHIGSLSYYDEIAIETAFFLLTRPGGSGYAAPGSSYKDKLAHTRRKRVKSGQIMPALTEVDADFWDRISNDHELLFQMAKASSTNSKFDAELARALVSYIKILDAHKAKESKRYYDRTKPPVPESRNTSYIKKADRPTPAEPNPADDPPAPDNNRDASSRGIDEVRQSGVLSQRTAIARLDTFSRDP